MFHDEERLAFSEVGRLGLGRTVHAGEDGPAEAVRQAVQQLGATRIGHGYHTVDDEVRISVVFTQLGLMLTYYFSVHVSPSTLIAFPAACTLRPVQTPAGTPGQCQRARRRIQS